MPRAAFVYSEELASFEYGDDHPFKPIRARNTRELCHRYGLLHGPHIVRPQPQPADLALIRAFHGATYLEILAQMSAGEARVAPKLLAHGLGTDDCPPLAEVFEFSLRAAGATLCAVDLVLGGQVDRAFNLVGGFHHAGRNHAEGFCYVNDVGVAIEYLLARGLRPAFVDFDAHHCNGVQEAFYKDDRVLVVSFHESGKTLYPWGGDETQIGAGRGRGFNVNVPLLAGSDDEVFVPAFRRIVPPLLDAYGPDILLAEVGADTLISDPLTHLRLTNNGHRAAVEELARRPVGLVALGGGGYDIYRTARCWSLAWSCLCGLEPEEDYAALSGGAMHGVEMEALRDAPLLTQGEAKDRALTHADEVASFLEKTVFPLLGARRA